MRKNYLLLTIFAGCAIDAQPDMQPDTDSVDIDNPTPYWAVNSVTDEAGSTHLWIVDRATDVLGQHSEGTRARSWLLNATCKSRWQQGLYDADYRHEYNGGRFDLTPSSSTITIGLSGATWAPHFYDPDSGQNYKGQTSPTAKTEALAHAANAK